MATLGELLVNVGADISEFTKGMKKVDQTMKDTGKGLQNSGKKMSSVGKDLSTKITAPMTALGTTAVLMSANFDQQMSKVQAVSGATGKEFENLRSTARELGRSTAWSAQESAQGMEFLARAGWESQEIISAMPSVLDLATASAIDLGTASDIASNIISGFGGTAQDAQRYIDVLAKTTASSNTDMNQLGDAMKYVAPVANTLGLSVEETASAIGIMSDAGIQGSQAGTTLRQGLLKLTSPTKEAKGLMDDLGMSFFDAEGQMKSMPEIMSQLENGLAGMKDEQKAQALETMFGAEAVSGFSALLESGSGNVGKFAGELKNAEGTAGDMADTMNNNLMGRLKELWSQISDIAIELGQSLTPYVEKAVSWFSKLADWVANLSGRTKAIILVVGALVAGLAPLLAIVGLVVSGIGTLVGAIGAISLPVVAVIAGITALGVALVALWNKSETFRDTVTAVFTAIKEKVLQAIGVVKDFLKDKLSQIQKFWNENGEMILQAVQNAFDGIKAVVEFVMPFVLGVIKYVWNAIQGVINGALNIIMGVVKVFAGLFTGNFSKMWEGVKQLFSGAIEFVWNLMNLSFVGGIKKLIVGFVKNIGKKIKGLWETVKLQFMYGKDKAVGFITNLKTKGLSIFNTMKDKVKTIFNKVKDFITNPIKTAKEKISGFIDDIKGFFTNLKLKIPKPKFPKVSVTKKTGVLGIPYPDFDISWNAKGGIFNGASLLGGGQGVGEAGAEAVLPIQHKRYMRPFANAVASQLPTGEGNEPTVVENHVTTVIELDGQEVGRKVEKYVSQQQMNRQKRTNRLSGR
ncbi:phage tail tape measure protein [Bacillus paralicheniformis]|uniref:phage tail tape measure protein n=1 Tax=Bacillus paralicheniformis TaxID=1648923 RepID=UPI00189E6F2D|nr:phage tail tape measure protein [Bacillus paralicheniformis]